MIDRGLNLASLFCQRAAGVSSKQSRGGGFARLTALRLKLLALSLTEVIIIEPSNESSGENGFGGDEGA